MGIAAMVLGIIGMIVSIIPCLGMYALPGTILAIILGILGLKHRNYYAMATAGIACGAVGTAAGGVWLYLYIRLTNDLSVDHYYRDAAVETAPLEAQPVETPPAA